LNDFIKDLDFKPYNFTHKSKTIKDNILYMLNRSIRMFKYDGLPDTIPHKFLELYLQTNGHCGFVKKDDNLYVVSGTFGGEPNPYYIPKDYIVANPSLNISKDFNIATGEIIVGCNDSLMQGLFPMYKKYASLLCENEITLRNILILNRMHKTFKANNEQAKQTAEAYLNRILEGKLSSLVDNAKGFIEGISIDNGSNTASQNAISQLIELEQYLRSLWYNDIGLNSNYNMKRESLNSNETQLNDDMLIPLVDDMLICRQEMCEALNKKFGLNVTVELSPVWENNVQEAVTEESETKEGEEDVKNVE
jgi:hypothetical protein